METIREVNENIDSTPEYKKYKYTDKEYFKFYQRKIYNEKLCKIVECNVCGTSIYLKGLTRHKKSKKCMNFNLNNN